MLKTNFSNALQLHAVPLSRIKQFHEASTATLMRTIIIKIDTQSVPSSVKSEILEMIAGYGRDLSYLYALLEQREFRRYCCGQRFIKLRGRLRAEHQANQKNSNDKKPLSKGGLQGKMWKTALEDACHMYNRYWRSAQERAHDNIKNLPLYPKLNDAERYYIGGLLKCINDRFFDLLDGKTPTPISSKSVKGTIQRIRDLARLVRAEVRKAAGSTPHHGCSRSLTLTNECYQILKDNNNKYSIQFITRTPRARMSIDLPGNLRFDRTIKVVYENGELFLHIPHKVTVQPLSNVPQVSLPNGKPALYAVGLDMGASEVYVDDSGNKFGTNLGKTLWDFALSLDKKLRERNKFETAYRLTKNTTKKRNIKRCNLGKKVWDERIRRYRETLKNIVNHAINQIFKNNPADVYVIEKFSNSFSMKGISKKTRRMLSVWIRGIIKERLEFKAGARGVWIICVPSSYSSQRCPICGRVHRSNRNKDNFECGHCHHKAQSDENGALNLLLAAHETKIKKGMDRYSVKTVYRKEYEKFCKKSKQQPLPA